MTRIREGRRRETLSHAGVAWADRLRIISPPASAGRNCEHRTVNRVMFLSMVTAPRRRRDISSMGEQRTVSCSRGINGIQCDPRCQWGTDVPEREEVRNIASPDGQMTSRAGVLDGPRDP